MRCLQAYSRDGTNFTFIDRTPWLRPGLAGSSSSRQLWLGQPGPVRMGDEELYFVTGANSKEYRPRAATDTADADLYTCIYQSILG